VPNSGDPWQANQPMPHDSRAGWPIGAYFCFSAEGAPDREPHPEGLLLHATEAIFPLVPVEIVIGRFGEYRNRVRKYRELSSALKAWSDPAVDFMALTSEMSSVPDLHLRDYAGISMARRASSGAEVRELSVMRAVPSPAPIAVAFVEQMVRIFSSTSAAQYGCVHAASDYRYLRIEAAVKRGNPMVAKTIEHTIDRFELVYPHYDQLGEKIIGAHWGVLLGRALLDQLGGRERVTREAPVYRVRPLDHGAALLQLTPTPAPLFAPEMLAALPAFEAYLEPISIPIGPYFRRKIAEMTDNGSVLG
jgi:hypothetical protein